MLINLLSAYHCLPDPESERPAIGERAVLHPEQRELGEPEADGVALHTVHVAAAEPKQRQSEL